MKPDGAHLVLHVLQPVQPQVGDDARRAVIHRQDVNFELLRRSCHDLQEGLKKKQHVAAEIKRRVVTKRGSSWLLPRSFPSESESDLENFINSVLIYI